MEIPVYHKAVAKNALTAGLDASVYGMVKQGLSAPGYSSGGFMGRQLVHIGKSLLAHRGPSRFLKELFPETLADKLEQYLDEGYEIALGLPRPNRGGAASNWDCAIVYATAKALNPAEMIETGTGVGATSCMALRGSHESTRLITFDRVEEITGHDAIPYYRWDELPRGGVGQLIPGTDEHRVDFILGDIKETLPAWVEHERLSPRNPTLALVILDSLHTPEHQEFELAQLWPALADGSIVLCDDTTYGWSNWINSYSNCGFLGGIRK